MVAMFVGQHNRGQVAGLQPGIAQLALDRALRQATVDQQRGAAGLHEQSVAAAARGD
jgi:hypothetical protein